MKTEHLISLATKSLTAQPTKEELLALSTLLSHVQIQLKRNLDVREKIENDFTFCQTARCVEDASLFLFHLTETFTF